jgi:hypothetical protein
LHRRSLVTLAFAAAACEDFPRDSRGTLRQVLGGQRPLRVGWSRADPWVTGTDEAGPGGLEPALVRRWADSSGATIQWIAAGEAQLVEGLQRHALDLAVAGMTDDAPWGSRIGQTQPYLEMELVVGVRRAVAVPPDWDGIEISHDRRRPEVAAAIRALGAVPVPAEPGAPGPLAAAWGAELEALGLQPSGKRLQQTRRVLATAPAESALTFALDRFLLPRQGEIRAMLAAQAGRDAAGMA